MTRADLRPPAATAAPAYRDPTQSIDARVGDLLARMTLDEKLAQLVSVWAFRVAPDSRFDRSAAEEVLADGMGEITRLLGSTNLTVGEAAEVHNQIQRYLVNETPLGIPAIVHEETIHGVLARGAPCFQQSIGAAATWDPPLVEQMAGTLRRRMLASGARHALAPVLDLGRDPRWGRIEETYGEDPYLAAEMGVAYVRGIQGPAGEEQVIATGKHLAGHGQSEGGLNQAPSHIGAREMRDEILLPFEAAIHEAGLRSVMPAYNDLDGVPCHASHQLLRTILRDEWGFDGIVAADYQGIDQLVAQHRMTPDLGEAAALALEAGVDLELPRESAYGEPAKQAIAAGRLDLAVVDAAVTHVLREKFRLGLFESPYVQSPSPAVLAALESDEQRVGRDLARRSLVLLENDGVLPLPSTGTIAVIGPIADSARDLLGDYSHLVHIETLLELRPGHSMTGYDITDAVSLEDELEHRPTILGALRARLGEERVRYARGTGLREGSDEELEAAIAVALTSDIAVLVLGERSGLTADSTTGEFRDRRDLGFLGRQQELLDAVLATGTPTVLVVASGRPLALESAARTCNAVLLAWVPGDEGPDAIAEVLTGEVSPSGKLPVSMPRHVGQVPFHYRHHPSGGRSNWKGDYVDGAQGPLWPFGYGRSYTTFEVSGLEIADPRIATDSGILEATVRVTNTGSRGGDEIVQLYFRDEAARVARPVLELCAFQRVHLEPGASAIVRFRLHAERFAYTDQHHRRIVEPGLITLRAGSSSADLPQSASFELTGAVVDRTRRRHFLTAASVHHVDAAEAGRSG